MSLRKITSAIRIIISMLILCMIENGTIVCRYNTIIIILCFIVLVFDTCYLAIRLSIKE